MAFYPLISVVSTLINYQINYLDNVLVGASDLLTDFSGCCKECFAQQLGQMQILYLILLTFPLSQATIRFTFDFIESVIVALRLTRHDSLCSIQSVF